MVRRFVNIFLRVSTSFGCLEKKIQTNGGRCEHRTPTQTACTDAHSVSQHVLNRMITFHHANTRGSRLHSIVCQNSCNPRVMSRSLPHLTLTTSTSSLSPTSHIFPTFSSSHPRPWAHDPFLPCEDSRQSWRISTNPISHTFMSELFQ